MTRTAIAYWLLPREPERAFFARVIHELAARFGAPEFEPHLTLFVAPNKSPAPAEILHAIGTVRLNLRVLGLRWSVQFTKTFFAQFECSNEIQELSDAICALTYGERSAIDPHLSLLYKRLPEQTTREFAASIQLPFKEVIFDSLCAMRCASPTRNAADVRAWKLIAAQNSNTR
ncbi:MAG: hypothetical protein ACR2FX_05890 [Chthoniobacterales bacterium]